MDQKLHHARVFSLLIILLFLAWSGNTDKILRLNLAPGKLETTSIAPAERVVARIYYRDLRDKNQLASHLEVWEVHEEESYLIALLSPLEWQDLSKSGYRIEIDAGKTRGLKEFHR